MQPPPVTFEERHVLRSELAQPAEIVALHRNTQHGQDLLRFGFWPWRGFPLHFRRDSASTQKIVVKSPRLAGLATLRFKAVELDLKKIRERSLAAGARERSHEWRPLAPGVIAPSFT